MRMLPLVALLAARTLTETEILCNKLMCPVRGAISVALPEEWKHSVNLVT